MKKRDQIIRDVKDLISDLSHPLSQAEVSAGWTVEAQNATLKLLSNVYLALIERRSFNNLNIGRGLDHWGIEEGDLLEKACALSNDLRALAD